MGRIGDRKRGTKGISELIDSCMSIITFTVGITGGWGTFAAPPSELHQLSTLTRSARHLSHPGRYRVGRQQNSRLIRVSLIARQTSPQQTQLSISWIKPLKSQGVESSSKVKPHAPSAVIERTNYVPAASSRASFTVSCPTILDMGNAREGDLRSVIPAYPVRF